MKTYALILLQFVIMISLGLQVSVAEDIDFLAEAASTASGVPLPLDVNDLKLLWEITVGDVGSDTVASLDQTNDGGYIFVGTTNSKGAGNYDVYMVKTDYYGNILWERTHGGNSNEYGWSVQQTLEGGYIVAGTTSSFGAGSSDGYLIKTSPAGTVEWYITCGGTKADEIYSVQQTSDHGFILAGKTESFGYGSGDAYLVKTDSSGKILWQKYFGGTNIDSASSVQETADHGFIICGSTSSFNDTDNTFPDFYLIKINSEGQFIWQRTFGSEDWADEAYSVKQTSDGGYIVTGSLRAYSIGFGTWDIGLVKFDKDGNVKWSKEFGGKGRDVGKSVQQTSDGGYIILAETDSFGSGSDDMYLIKTNPNGVKEWDMTLGGASIERGYAIETTYEGGYIIAGTTDSYGAGGNDFYLIRMGNFMPIANAGKNQTVYADFDDVAEVYLDASDSNDPEGDPLTYKWSWWVDGKAYESTKISLTIILPVGEHIVELFVNDGRQDSFLEEIVITVVGAMESDMWTFPRPIKRNRGGRRIRASLCPPEGIDADQIDISKPLLLYPGGIEAIRQRVRTSRINGIRVTHVLAFFNKAPLMAAIPKNGTAELKVIGQLKSGILFYGTDSVLIMEKIGRYYDRGENNTDDNNIDDGGSDTGNNDTGDDDKDDPKDDGKTDKDDGKNDNNVDNGDDDSDNSGDTGDNVDNGDDNDNDNNDNGNSNDNNDDADENEDEGEDNGIGDDDSIILI